MNSLREYTIYRFDGENKKVQDSVVVEEKCVVTLPDGDSVTIVSSPTNLDLLQEGVLVAFGYKKIVKSSASRCSNNDILNGISELSEISPLFNATGAVHIAALLEEGTITRFYDDVSRTTALYKLLGSLLSAPVTAKRATILLSSRINRQLMEAIVTSGISSVTAISAPTDQAIDMARKKGLFLAGFVRKGRMNIYAE